MTCCPFYAMSVLQTQAVSDATNGSWLILPTPRSNRCGLITNAHSPCRMELSEDSRPDWHRCIRNPENNGTGPIR